MTDQDRRSFTRIQFDADTRLQDEGQYWDVKLLDISLQGLLVSVPDNWPDPMPAKLTATLTLDSNNQIVMQVTPCHREADHLGLRCEHMDVDSVSHLRRIVELNTGDSGLLDRELKTLSHSG